MGAFATRFAASAAALTAALALTGSAQAAVIDWTVSAVFESTPEPDVFTGGFSGTFRYDTVLNQFLSWHIESTSTDEEATPPTTQTLVYGGPEADSYSGFEAGDPFFREDLFGTPLGDLGFVLVFDNFDPGTVGTFELEGAEFVFALPVNPAAPAPLLTRNIVEGSATGVLAVPEPSTWALMILGFGAAGAGLRRRRLQAV